MTTSQKRMSLFIAVPLLLLFLPLSIYFVDSAMASDKVARNVSIEGTDVSRYSEEEAAEVVDAHADELTSRTISVVINDQTFELDPASVGVEFNRDAAVEEALTMNKGGLSEWVKAFRTEVDVPIYGSIDEDLLAQQITEWEVVAIENPAFEGAVTITNQTATPEYPQPGVAVDRDDAFDQITTAIVEGSTDTIELDVVPSEPTLTDADIDEATERAQTIIDRGVVLTNEEYEFEFVVNSFNTARALSVEVTKGRRGEIAKIDYVMDTGIIEQLAEGQRASLEIEPVDAYWETVVVDDFEEWPENYEITDSPEDDLTEEERAALPEDDTITLVPSKKGTRLDTAKVAEAVQTAVLGDGTGELVLDFTEDPEFTTEDAEAYGELYEVAEFTTYKPGTNRAHNIDLMADTIDQHIVWPGETFSVNEFIGRRTLDKGYKYDCAIVGGVLSCEEDPVNVGGGVSQFGTTIFNAIFFGCYKDVEHQPHSIYFSKYPEGREATLGYPHPDVAFENDTEAPVIIRTSHTPRSITVTFFGNNGGIICDSERSERTGVTSPRTEYRTDPERFVAPGEEYEETKGSRGWSVVVTRRFYDANGNEVREPEEFFWRYSGEKNIILVHPCDPRVGGDGDCPNPVPSVTGMSEADALAALAAAGYTDVAVNYVDVPGPSDRVVSQSHSGTYPEDGTTISISVDSSDDPPPDEDD